MGGSTLKLVVFVCAEEISMHKCPHSSLLPQTADNPTPLAGTLTEKYTLLEDGCLCVEADTRVGDKAANSKTVYRRSSGSRDQLLSDSKRRNPSVAAVLQQQRDSGLDV